MEYPSFPRTFLFGAATAAYQIEGAVAEDGRGQSVWDEFCRRRGSILAGDTGEMACDHYHRYREDIALMRTLGLDAYRFSLAWPRIIPDGDGAVNQAGLDFYSRLVDALLEAGVRPFVTLFHWDLPLELQKRYGGFADRRCISAYVRYVERVVSALGDRVKDWITFNEPWVYAVLGHLLGVHAPGVKNPWQAFRVMHHQLVAHGVALERIREISPSGRVGITLNLAPLHPASPRDEAAADLADQSMNRFFLDALFRGSYPERYWRRMGILRPPLLPDDMETIAKPIDFLGINNYTRLVARRSWKHPPFFFDIGEEERPDREYTAMGWEVYPRGIYELLIRLRREYGNPPVYVTENGAAFADRIERPVVRDPRRRAYLESYIKAVYEALQEGCDVRGYFVWSLLDNFEWAEGYSKRFGIVSVDFDSQERIVKESGRWYAALLAARSR